MQDDQNISNNKIFPYFTVSNIDRAIDFYKSIGFQVIDSAINKEGKIYHVEMGLSGSLIMFCEENTSNTEKKSPKTSGISIPLSLYLYVDDVDRTYKKALEHGATGIKHPEDGFWSDRFCAIIDPEGYEWLLAKKINKA